MTAEYAHSNKTTKSTTESAPAVSTTDSSTTTETGNASTQTEKKDYGTLNVSFPTGNIRISFDILALQLGYFEEEGVTVNPVNIIGNNALTAIEAESDSLDLLTAGFVADVQHIGSGASLTFVGGTAVEGGAIITKKGNASKYQDATNKINLEAVANAKYGLVRNQAAWIVTRSYLKKNYSNFTDDIDKEDVGKINFYDAEDKVALAVQQGAIDVGYTPLEYALLYQDSYQLDLVAATGELEPEYVCCREVTSKAKYEAKYDAFVAYEKARIRAWEYYANEANKDNVVKIVSEYSGKESSYVETYLYGGVTKFSTDPNELVTLSSITEQDNLPIKYLEQVTSFLVKARLIASIRGNNGGYRLTKKPNEYTIYEILSATEGCILPVNNVEEDTTLNAATKAFFKEYNKNVVEYLSNVSLEQLLEQHLFSAEDYSLYI